VPQSGWRNWTRRSHTGPGKPPVKREAIQLAQIRLADARKAEAAEAERARHKELAVLASVAIRHATEYTAALRQAVRAGAALKLVGWWWCHGRTPVRRGRLAAARATKSVVLVSLATAKSRS